MERAVAVKKLGKILGKGFGYRINDKAPTPEERAAAREQLPAAIQERTRLKEQKDARYRALIEADAEYQSLRAAHKAAQDRADRLQSMMIHYKITVGTSHGIFFAVKAEGDSWEEILDKVAKKEHA